MLLLFMLFVDKQHIVLYILCNYAHNCNNVNAIMYINVVLLKFMLLTKHEEQKCRNILEQLEADDNISM